VEVFRLDANQLDHWALIPQVVVRAMKFAREDLGYVPPLLKVRLLAHFVGGTVEPDKVEIACWVGVADWLVRAHTLVELADEHGLPYLVISQHASDPGYPYGRAALRILDEVIAWGRQKGALRIRTQARSRKLSRAYRVFYGFRELERVVMEREL